MNAAVLMLSACLGGGDVTPAAFVHGHDCAGHASVCGDCCDLEAKCGLLRKLKNKLFCCGHLAQCNPCSKHNDCQQPACPKPACPKPACEPKPACQPKPVCQPKPACQPTCDSGCNTHKCCWTPGYFIHKCKGKLFGLCDKGQACDTGCGSAVVAPPAAAPAPAPAPKAEPKKMPVSSAYPLVRPGVTISQLPSGF